MVIAWGWVVRPTHLVGVSVCLLLLALVTPVGSSILIYVNIKLVSIISFEALLFDTQICHFQTGGFDVRTILTDHVLIQW